MEILFFAILGLCIGSFLNVLIVRIPKGENIAFPASHCVTCNKPLKWYHNIPLLSWLFLRGRCSYCHDRISLQYPIVELLNTVIFIVAALKYNSLTQILLSSLVFSLLLALSAIDFKYKAVPDVLSIPALFLSLFIYDFLPSLQAALVLAGAFSLLRIVLSWLIKKEAMGEADIIIAGVIGGVLGIKLGLSAIYIAALISLPVFMVVSKKGYQLPFIPFLSLGLFFTWALDTQVLSILEMIYE
jgi:leader peptidase (prepilin peptidase) / N-methyltransferase